MERDRRKYQLESLEQRLLLSGSGVLDELVAGVPTNESLVQVQAYEVDEQITISNQANSTYYPEAQLSDLFAKAEKGAEPEADLSELASEDPFTDTLAEADDQIEDIGEPTEEEPDADSKLEKRDTLSLLDATVFGELSNAASVDSEVYGEAGTRASENLSFSIDQNETAEQSSSDQLISATSFAQSSTADELVETLNAAQPPPANGHTREGMMA